MSIDFYDVTAKSGTRFRRVPRARVLSDTRDRERNCGEHTLVITDERHIECMDCGAEWKDEGF